MRLGQCWGHCASCTRAVVPVVTVAAAALLDTRVLVKRTSRVVEESGKGYLNAVLDYSSLFHVQVVVLPDATG